MGCASGPRVAAKEDVCVCLVVEEDDAGCWREEEQKEGQRRRMVQTLLFRVCGCWAGGSGRGVGRVRGCGGSGGEGGAEAGDAWRMVAFGVRACHR
jgi:hypothetical protein